MSDKSFVHLFYTILHVFAFGLRQRTNPDRTEHRHAHIGRRIGLDHIDRNSQLVLEPLFSVQHQPENSDRTGLGHR